MAIASFLLRIRLGLTLGMWTLACLFVIFLLLIGFWLACFCGGGIPMLAIGYIIHFEGVIGCHILPELIERYWVV